MEAFKIQLGGSGAIGNSTVEYELAGYVFVDAAVTIN